VFVFVVCFLLGIFPASEFLYADVSEHPVCSETLTNKIQTPGNYPDENIQHSKRDEGLKSRIVCIYSYDKHCRKETGYFQGKLIKYLFMY
jgi:hypothetical protein